MEIPLNDKTPKILLVAWVDYHNGKISLEELQHICYLWAMEYAWSEYISSPLPSEPLDVIEWRNMTPNQRKGLSEPIKAHFEGILRGYLKHYLYIRNTNNAKLDFLYEMKEYFDGKDKIRHRTIMERIDEFTAKKSNKKPRKTN